MLVTGPKIKKISCQLSLICLGVIFSLILLTLLDKLLGIYLNKVGYFKAAYPEVKIIFDTNEFQLIDQISSQGLKNELVKVPKPPGVTRILAIGDSFTYGWGVQLADAWPRLLQQQLNEDGSGRVEIINVGIPGAGIGEDTWTCQAYKDQFQADEVIIVLYSDDLYQAASLEITPTLAKFLASTWPTLVRLNHPIISPLLDGIDQNQLSSKTIYSSKSWQNYVQGVLSKQPDILNKIDPSLRGDFLQGLTNPAFITKAAQNPDFLSFVLDTGKFNFALREAAGQLKKLKTDCLGQTPGLLLYLPSAEQVSSFYFDFKKRLGFQVDERLASFDLDSPLQTVAQQIGLTYVPVLQHFRHDGCESCFYHWDIHLTKEGNKKVAQWLTPALHSWLDSFRQSKN